MKCAVCGMWSVPPSGGVQSVLCGVCRVCNVEGVEVYGACYVECAMWCVCVEVYGVYYVECAMWSVWRYTEHAMWSIQSV